METQAQQLKLNVTNISSFLKQSNKTYIGLKKQNSTLLSNQIQKRKLEAKEKRIETKNISNFGLGRVGNAVASTADNIFDRVLGFGSLVLAGILVNGLPKIVETVKGLIDSIVEFVTPIQSAFNLIKAFMEGDWDETKYNADKKRVDDKLEELNKEGGLIDQIAEKTGVLEPFIKLLKPVVEQIRNIVGGKKMVLAMKGGKEGVLDKGTGEFTERQFTTSERERYKSGGATTPASSPSSSDPFYGGQKRSESGYFNQIYNLAVKHGAKFPEVVAAQAMHETGFMDPNLPSVFNATGRTNPFGQTGDRGYGTITRQGDSSGWTKYPSLDIAVKDHIALWHRVSNHPRNYEAFSRAIDGIAAVAPVYSPDADPANIKLGYTADGYSSAMVRILKDNGFDPYKLKTNKPRSRVEAKKLGNAQASVLNTTMGEDGSTTIVFATQQVIT